MGDGHSFYPDLALLAEVYDGMTAQEQTKWAEDKVADELSTWGCSLYEDYLAEAREWEETHYLASMELNLKNYGEFGPASKGRMNRDTLGGELVGKLGKYMEYDEFLLALEQLLRAIDKYLLNQS